MNLYTYKLVPYVVLLPITRCILIKAGSSHDIMKYDLNSHYNLYTLVEDSPMFHVTR